MKNLIIIYIMLFIFSSCIKESSTHTYVKLTNSSGAKIELIPYLRNLIDSSKIKIINPNETITLERTSIRGKNQNPVYWFDYFMHIDSIQVIWNDSFLVTHMISDSFYSNNKYIQASYEGRNLGAGGAYFEKKVRESKHSVTWDVIYTFTEADYNFAKD